MSKQCISGEVKTYQDLYGRKDSDSDSDSDSDLYLLRYSNCLLHKKKKLKYTTKGGKNHIKFHKTSKVECAQWPKELIGFRVGTATCN